MDFDDFVFLDDVLGEIKDYVGNIRAIDRKMMLEIIRDVIDGLIRGYEGGHHG